MRTVHIELPAQEYAEVLSLKAFGAASHRKILNATEKYGSCRMVVFGKGSTGHTVRDLLGERFLRFVDSETLSELKWLDFDAVLVATSPLHYPSVLRGLAENLPSKEVDAITIFGSSSDVDIALVLETQPRSGTHYTIDNLVRCLGLGYGSVFREDGNAGFRRSRDGRFYYEYREDKRSYIIKSHFFQPLHFPEYRFAKTVFQVSYVFDSYYSWGRMLAMSPKSTAYRLLESSKEWSMLRSYIPLNRQWLSYVRDHFFVRYEDYYRDFNGTIRRISDFLGIPRLEGFAPPRPNMKRTFWSDGYHDLMDENVFLELLREFSEQIRFFWPEKADRLSYRGSRNQ